MVLNNANSGLAYISTDYIVQWENISMCSASLSHKAYRKGTICYQSTRGRTSPCENCVMQLSMRSRQMEQAKFTFDNGHTVEVFATPVFRSDRTIDGVVVRIDDVTERERMIKELKQAKALAEQSDKLKSAFLANMSHEIRTPLNAIVGFSELLADESRHETRREYTDIILRNNTLLLQIISDVLDLARIESGRTDIERTQFDARDLCREVADSLRLQRRPGVELRVEEGLPEFPVTEYRKGLAQVLNNFTRNALKFTEKGSVTIGFRRIPGHIRFYVRDTGIGIAPEDRERIFERFVKLDTFTQGTGLGLSICKSIAEQLGGSVGVDSVAGEGSCFRIDIPAGE